MNGYMRICKECSRDRWCISGLCHECAVKVASDYFLTLGSIQSAVAEALDLDRTPTTAQEVKEAILAKLRKEI